MIYLILSIVFSSVTVSFFKIFELKKVDTFQAIIANYFTCSLIGTYYSDHHIWTIDVLNSAWLPFAVLLGLLFVGIFYSIALTAQRISVSISMVAAKLSVVIPVVAAWLFYHEQLNAMKIAGIIVSMFAVLYISKKSEESHRNDSHLWYFPVLVFLGSGSIDTLINYLESSFIPPFTADDILTTAFFFAFLAGIFILIFKKEKPGGKSLFWGVFLGVPNYFSMYFLVKTLGGFDATFIFPINNIGIVVVSTIIAWQAFKEKINRENLVGILMAVIAILLISFS